MDFQGLLNLIKGNLGGAGMQTAEDGSAVHAGYNQPQPNPAIPQLPQLPPNPLEGLPLDQPDPRALQVSGPGEQYLEQPPAGYHSPLTEMGQGQPQMPIQGPAPIDFQALLRGLLGQ